MPKETFELTKEDKIYFVKLYAARLKIPAFEINKLIKIYTGKREPLTRKPKP